jgi:hypothetical protein
MRIKTDKVVQIWLKKPQKDFGYPTPPIFDL